MRCNPAKDVVPSGIQQFAMEHGLTDAFGSMIYQTRWFSIAILKLPEGHQVLFPHRNGHELEPIRHFGETAISTSRGWIGLFSFGRTIVNKCGLNQHKLTKEQGWGAKTGGLNVLLRPLVILPPIWGFLKTFDTKNGDNSNGEWWKLHYFASRHGNWRMNSAKDNQHIGIAVNVNLVRLICQMMRIRYHKKRDIGTSMNRNEHSITNSFKLKRTIRNSWTRTQKVLVWQERISRHLPWFQRGVFGVSPGSQFPMKDVKHPSISYTRLASTVSCSSISLIRSFGNSSTGGFLPCWSYPFNQTVWYWYHFKSGKWWTVCYSLLRLLSHIVVALVQRVHLI